MKPLQHIISNEKINITSTHNSLSVPKPFCMICKLTNPL